MQKALLPLRDERLDFRGTTLLDRSKSGAEGTRTPDPNTASVVLSQLSYSPKPIRLLPDNGGQPAPTHGSRPLPTRLTGEFDQFRCLTPNGSSLPNAVYYSRSSPIALLKIWRAAALHRAQSYHAAPKSDKRSVVIATRSEAEIDSCLDSIRSYRYLTQRSPLGRRARPRSAELSVVLAVDRPSGYAVAGAPLLDPAACMARSCTPAAAPRPGNSARLRHATQPAARVAARPPDEQTPRYRASHQSHHECVAAIQSGGSPD
jgi:hypothetical protein